MMVFYKTYGYDRKGIAKPIPVHMADWNRITI